MSSTMDKVLQDAVSAGDVPTVVAVAANDHDVIYEGAAGPRAAGENGSVSADTLFRIASMTKMVCTVAALQQLERGNLNLDDPVEKYRPEFAEIYVLAGFDGDTPKLRPAASKATVKQLLTHTSGLSYWFWNADIVRWEKATGASGSASTFTAPMVVDPGTKFEYGINADWLGKIVEAVSGQSLDVYFRENITGPLGMTNTTFIMSAEQRANSVPVHVQAEDGSWKATDVDWNQKPDWWAGGHGLYSTPHDYLKFQRALLGGGTLNGVKILEKSTVDSAFTNQIGDKNFPPAIKTTDPGSTCDFNAGPGMKWGYGLLLNIQRQPGMRAAGSGAWAGFFNTHFWIDPATRVAGAIYSQFLPFVTPKSMEMYANFEKALYASL